MNKFTSGLVKELRDNEAKERSKKNKVKFKKIVTNITFSPITFFVRKIATILLLILAAIGLLALIYPTTRNEMWDILNNEFQHIYQLINF